MPRYHQRPAAARGRNRLAWLDARHSFSFAGYQDPAWRGFHGLRVINEDRIAPAGGFGEHGHAHMEILTYVIEGRLAHRDSTGGDEEMRHGRIQLMSAGTGIRHSEVNASQDEPVHLLQIWMEPHSRTVRPAYQMADVAVARPGAGLTLLAAPNNEAATVIHADAQIWGGTLQPEAQWSVSLEGRPAAWIQVVRGAVTIAEQELSAGDGLGIEDIHHLSIINRAVASEVLVFALG